jgi:phospholipase C
LIGVTSYLLAATSAGHAVPLAAPETPLTATTIFEELQNAGIAWKIYVIFPFSLWLRS